MRKRTWNQGVKEGSTRTSEKKKFDSKEKEQERSRSEAYNSEPSRDEHAHDEREQTGRAVQAENEGDLPAAATGRGPRSSPAVGEPGGLAERRGAGASSSGRGGGGSRGRERALGWGKRARSQLTCRQGAGDQVYAQKQDRVVRKTSWSSPRRTTGRRGDQRLSGKGNQKLNDQDDSARGKAWRCRHEPSPGTNEGKRGWGRCVH